MGSLNRALVIGNIGSDAELRYTSGGAAVASFSVATSESWKDKQTGQKREQTEWHKIVLWGQQAETLTPYLRKGKQVCVEGRLQTRSWEDKEGKTRYVTEIKADRVVLLGSGGGRAESASAEVDDDVPF